MAVYTIGIIFAWQAIFKKNTLIWLNKKQKSYTWLFLIQFQSLSIVLQPWYFAIFGFFA
jgi:hypothetical protein